MRRKSAGLSGLQELTSMARMANYLDLVAVADSGLAFGRGSDPDHSVSSSEICSRARGNHMKRDCDGSGRSRTLQSTLEIMRTLGRRRECL